MSPEMINNWPESGMNLKETELTLGLPGEPRVVKSCMKRVFSETVDLELGNSGCQNKKLDSSVMMNKESATSRGQVVGWPPVRAHRKKIMTSGKYVKVAVDGAPYLRKVDLELYKGYEQLLSAVEGLFTCFSIRNVLDGEKKYLMDTVNGVEYVATYEDKDGDWMLLGDVPWKMFAESCKRIRLMKRSEAIGLAPRPETKCSSSSC